MRRRSSVRRIAAGRVVLALVRHDVGEGEVGVALQADVDEGGVHAGQDVLDDALEDGADDPLLALDAVLGQLAVLEEGDAGLAVGDVDDDLLGEGLRAARAVGRTRWSRGWRWGGDRVGRETCGCSWMALGAVLVSGAGNRCVMRSVGEGSARRAA